MKKRIFIVDDHALLRRGYAFLIERTPDLEIAGEASSAEEALEKLSSMQVDALVTDISLEGMNGIELVKRLRSEYPDLPALVVSIHDEAVYADRAFRAGARGYVTKGQNESVILEALYDILAGGNFGRDTRVKNEQTPAAKRPGGEADVVALLTDRELEVFELYGRGLTTRQVGERLRISPKTVETHRGRIKEKLLTSTTAEMVQRAVLWVAQAT
jgi:DNA-binding NarL/FixJ family response regulator